MKQGITVYDNSIPFLSFPRWGGVGTSPGDGTIRRVAAFARGATLIRWAKPREASWVEVIVVVSRGCCWGNQTMEEPSVNSLRILFR